jgi:hypothetical protein
MPTRQNDLGKQCRELKPENEHADVEEMRLLLDYSERKR